MRHVACYLASVMLAGTKLGCVALGPTVVWHGTSEPASLDAAPARMTLTEMTCFLVKLVSVSDLPQAQMTCLIHPARV
jgi:hypothetical protein